MGNGKTDILQVFLKILGDTKSLYCIIGGLAVNAYVEPVVSLDLGMVVAMDEIEEVCKERFGHTWMNNAGRVNAKKTWQILCDSSRHILHWKGGFRAA